MCIIRWRQRVKIISRHIACKLFQTVRASSATERFSRIIERNKSQLLQTDPRDSLRYAHHVVHKGGRSA